MNRDIFADLVAVADGERATRLLVEKLLCRAAKDSAFANVIVAAQRRSRLDDGPRFEVAAVADPRLPLNHAEWADFHVLAKLGIRIDQSRRMDARRHRCRTDAFERVSRRYHAYCA